MEESWQLYDDQGRPIAGQGANKDDVFGKGLLHGAAHVWIWRNNKGEAEVLLQKRASNKRTWPNKYDISAAGHIDLGEEPLTAALREAKEEIGLDIGEEELKLFAVYRSHMVAENDTIENELRWLYIFEITEDFEFNLQESEVDSLQWKPLVTFKAEFNNGQYVPHGNIYYETVTLAIEAALTGKS